MNPGRAQAQFWKQEGLLECREGESPGLQPREASFGSRGLAVHSFPSRQLRCEQLCSLGLLLRQQR